MRARLGAELDVVDVQEPGPATSGHGALSVLPPEDQPPCRGRDILVGVTLAVDVLGIAQGGLGDGLIDGDLLTRAVLGRRAAGLAHGHRDLIRTPPVLGGTTEH